MTVFNVEKKYRELKKSIRMMDSQRSDVEKNYPDWKRKKIDTNELLSAIKLLITV